MERQRLERSVAIESDGGVKALLCKDQVADAEEVRSSENGVIQHVHANARVETQSIQDGLQIRFFFPIR